MNEELVPIVLFLSTAVVLCLWLYLKSRGRLAVQQTIQAVIEKGQELSPELLERLGQPQRNGDKDLRSGIIALAIGAAFAIFAFVLNEPDAIRPMLAAAAFPSMIGVAYLSLWLFAGKKDG